MKDTQNAADMSPDELGALKVVVREFMTRLANIDNELETLKEDRKELVKEYSEKLDYKTLQAAMRVTKIQSEVAHKDTYENFLEILTDPS